MMAKILVVDDDPDFLLVTGRTLESAGYEVVTADNGKQALERVAEAGPFDLFIVDAMMSTYTEGFELATSCADARRRAVHRS